MFSLYALAAIEWTLTVIAFLFLCVRLWMRWRQGVLSTSDMMVVFGFGFMVVSVALDFKTAHDYPATLRMKFNSDGVLPEFTKYFPDDADRVRFLKHLYVSNANWAYWSLYAIKGSFLSLYFQLFPKTHTRLRWALLATIIFTVVSCLATAIINCFWCWPIHRNWSANEDELCLASLTLFPQAMTFALHIISDLAVFLLPIALLPILKLSHKKRMGFVMTFAIGGICIICSVVRATFAGATGLWMPTSMCTTAEMSTGVIVACLPMIKRLYADQRKRRSLQKASEGRTAPTENENDPEEGDMEIRCAGSARSSMFNRPGTATPPLGIELPQIQVVDVEAGTDISRFGGDTITPITSIGSGDTRWERTADKR